VPGYGDLWSEFQAERGDKTERTIAEALAMGEEYSGTIGTPEDMRRHLRDLEAVGVDQVIFLQQAGRNRHDHICEALELFAAEVAPEFRAREAARQERKAAELRPYVEAALARKKYRAPLSRHEVPVVKASVAAAQVPNAPGSDPLPAAARR
jgi:hypothetical protein